MDTQADNCTTEVYGSRYFSRIIEQVICAIAEQEHEKTYGTFLSGLLPPLELKTFFQPCSRARLILLS